MSAVYVNLTDIPDDQALHRAYGNLTALRTGANRHLFSLLWAMRQRHMVTIWFRHPIEDGEMLRWNEERLNVAVATIHGSEDGLAIDVVHVTVAGKRWREVPLDHLHDVQVVGGTIDEELPADLLAEFAHSREAVAIDTLAGGQ